MRSEGWQRYWRGLRGSHAVSWLAVTEQHEEGRHVTVPAYPYPVDPRRPETRGDLVVV